MLNYPFSIFLYQSEQIIEFFNVPFYENYRMTDQGMSEYFRAKFMQPLVSAMDENWEWLQPLHVPKDEVNDLPILIDGNVTITRAKVIIMNIQTGNKFIPLFRRPCLISCETLSVKLPLAPFEFKYNLLINCSSIIDLDHWRELFTKQSQLKSSILKSADKRIL